MKLSHEQYRLVVVRLIPPIDQSAMLLFTLQLVLSVNRITRIASCGRVSTIAHGHEMQVDSTFLFLIHSQRIIIDQK